MKRIIVNESRITFPSASRNESFARAAAAAFAAQSDPTVQEIAAVKTAVSEAVTNAIVHGYRGAAGTVEMTLRLYADGERLTLYIAVRDKGTGIADVARAMEPLYSTAPADEERSGLGFTLMESFMDKVRVRSAEGKGTTVILEKNLSAREKYVGEPRREAPDGGRLVGDRS